MVKVAYALVLAWACACTQADIDAPVELTEADADFFRCEVQPVLAARCAFMACHGTDERPLRVYAEQRFRLGIPWTEYETALTDDELAANFRAARGFLSDDPDREHQLTEKPLDTRAGGLFHRGRDLFGDEDVFTSRDDVGYQILVLFADGGTSPSDCTPREDVGL